MDPLSLLWLYAKVFILILFGYYLIPAGSIYFILYVWKRKKLTKYRIQERYPGIKSIRREIKWSLITILISSVLVTILVLLVRSGYSKMYFNIQDYGWTYFLVSTILFIVLYDTYFYWLHRFMHLKKVFPVVHRVHHMSSAPTPWASLAFHPLETILEFMIYPLAIFLFPLHPVCILVFVIYNIILNTGGHMGFEMTPTRFLHHPFFKFGLTVTHHEMHHRNVKHNYGVYFNIWDRIMGTNHPDYEETFMQVKSKLKKS